MNYLLLDEDSKMKMELYVSDLELLETELASSNKKPRIDEVTGWFFKEMMESNKNFRDKHNAVSKLSDKEMEKAYLEKNFSEHFKNNYIEKHHQLIFQIDPETGKERTRSDKLFDGFIKPICNELSLSPVRADKINKPGRIDEDIISNLNSAMVVVVDITGLNANVFFELGYRYKTEKPFVILRETNSSESPPFDVSQIRIFPYSFDNFEMEAMKVNIKEAIISAISQNPSESVMFSGKRTDFVATEHDNGSISFNIRKKE